MNVSVSVDAAIFGGKALTVYEGPVIGRTVNGFVPALLRHTTSNQKCEKEEGEGTHLEQ
jgi:hypothetical protein